MSFDSGREHKITSGKTLCGTWSMAKSAKKGEDVCADHCVVKEAGDKVLIAVIDGLGHGVKANEASKYAVSTLENFKGESVIDLVNQCHRNLKNTRGAVMSLCVIDCNERILTWLGVGNVEGLLVRGNAQKRQRSENIILRGGVVGYELPSLKASLIPFAAGDMLIFTTDGVDRDYWDDVIVNDNPLEMVKKISRKYFKDTDDALIMALEFTEQ